MDAQEGKCVVKYSKTCQTANHYRCEAEKEVFVHVDDAMEYLTGEARIKQLLNLKSQWNLR